MTPRQLGVVRAHRPRLLQVAEFGLEAIDISSVERRVDDHARRRPSRIQPRIERQQGFILAAAMGASEDDREPQPPKVSHAASRPVLTRPTGCDTIAAMTLTTATLDASVSPPSAMRALARAWHRLGEDPVRLLSASAGVLALDLLVGWAGWLTLGDPEMAGTFAVIVALRLMAGVPLELVALSWAAEAMDGRARPTWEPLRALPFAWLERALGWVGGALLAAPAAALTIALLATGAIPAALLAVGLAGLGFVLGQAAGRAPLAMVPVRMVALGEPVREAWRRSVRPGPIPWSGRAWLLVIASVARGIGTALGIAPALPTAPLVHLTLLARLFPEDGCAPSSRA